MTLVCVVEGEGERARAGAFLARVAKELRPLDVQPRALVASDVLGALLDESGRDYDLVLLGYPDGRDRAGGLGTVLDGLLRFARCSVLVAAGSPPAGWVPRRLLVS